MRRHWLLVLLWVTFLLSGVLEMAHHHLAATYAAGWFASLLVFAIIRGVVRAGAPKLRQ